MSNATALAREERQQSKDFAYSNKKAAQGFLDIQAIITRCTDKIAPVWPLETFVACNPLKGFEGESFEEALIKNQGHLKRQRNERNPQLEDVNLQMIKWCGAILDVGQGSIEMPQRQKGFFLGFLALVPFDKTIHRHNKNLKEWLLNLPTSAEKTVLICLQKLGVAQGNEEDFILETLRYLPGWAGYVRWKADWQNKNNSSEMSVSLLDFLAVRLVITCLLWPEAAKNEKKNAENGSFIEHTMREIKNNEDVFKKELLAKMIPASQNLNINNPRSDAQLVFCIDVRSEPFRRAIEQQGHYETIGFAGFFGLPIRVREYHNQKTKDCCPVLLTPQFEVAETPIIRKNSIIQQYKKIQRLNSLIRNLYQQLKYNFSTPFILVESLGLWCGLSMLLQSIHPQLMQQIKTKISALISPPIPTQPEFESLPHNFSAGISLHDQIQYAEASLRNMGLTEKFAKLIIFCGHGSTTNNNPYAAALHCGACGGHHGATNAQILAAILNKEDVRRELELRGIHIPFDSVFYGALHNTTTDEVDIFNPSSKFIYPQIYQRLQTDLHQAKFTNNLERGPQLHTNHPRQDCARRSIDWSETRPEWGLARHAAFIVGPRALTQDINLQGRCFLHSYNWQQDHNAQILENILTAPMIVAQWINTQYLFSTLDNVAYGSGSKVTHNITGKIGIMQGNGSDLMHGLPLQSVMLNDATPYHHPQRLLVVIHAPKSIVSTVINKHAALSSLFSKEWLLMVVIDPLEELPYELTPNGDWKKVH